MPHKRSKAARKARHAKERVRQKLRQQALPLTIAQTSAPISVPTVLQVAEVFNGSSPVTEPMLTPPESVVDADEGESLMCAIGTSDSNDVSNNEESNVNTSDDPTEAPTESLGNEDKIHILLRFTDAPDDDDQMSDGVEQIDDAVDLGGDETSEWPTDANYGGNRRGSSRWFW